MKFGRLEVVSDAARDRAGRRRVNVLCDCGNTKVVDWNNMKRGLSKSCGCLQREAASAAAKVQMTKHGRSRTAAYQTWNSMRHRCENPKATAFQLYGGRGIKVCDRWRTFENFVADMGERPPGLTLDRINCNGPYAPDNCRWATPTEQSRNRNMVKMSMEIADAIRRRVAAGEKQSAMAREYGVNKATVSRVIKGTAWVR